MDYSLKYYDLFWVGFFVKNPVECDRLNLIIMDHFLPFYYPLPPKNPINQSFEKMKKKMLEILSFYSCTKNRNHMRYSS